MIYVFNNIENSSAREQISYSQFKQEVLSDRVAKIVYKGDQMTITGDRLDGSKFETTHPIFKRDEVLENAIEDNGVIAVYEKIEQPSLFSQLLVGAFPIILLLNNSSYGTIRMHQEKSFPDRVYGTDIENPDYNMIAKAYGIPSYKVSKTEEFQQYFDKAIKSKKGALIEIILDNQIISPYKTLNEIKKDT